MAEADFTQLGDNLDDATVKRAPTLAFTPPTGGGSVVFGMASKNTNAGVVGFFTNQANFAPAALGGSVRCAIQRYGGGGATNFAPFIFIGLGGTDSTDEGYILGLSDASPSYISLRKGALSGGLPASAPGVNGILARSTVTIEQQNWCHLRLDMIANPNGDVVLNCYRNVASVASPTWQGIAGLSQYIDDALGVKSGSLPFTSGRMGFASYFADVSRTVLFDRIECLRQIP